MKLQYFQNHWSELWEILESGPDFCRDHVKRDDANQSKRKSSNDRLRDCQTFLEIKYVGTLTYEYLKARSRAANFKNIIYLKIYKYRLRDFWKFFNLKIL